MEYILIVIIIAIVCTVYNLVSKVDSKNSISFMETLNLTELPIVTFLAGDTKINFLLDTGSSQSFIAENTSHLISGEEAVDNLALTSATGTEHLICKVIETSLTYKKKDYNVTLWVNESLNKAFSDLKNTQGITIHGILGSDFFSKYSYVLDFEKNIAYSKK